MKNGIENKKDQITVDVNQLRKMAHNRLDAAQKKLGTNGMAADKSADSLMGGLILSFLTWTPFMAGLDGTFAHYSGAAHDGAFDGAILSSALEGIATFVDEAANKNRNRKVEGYPEGRRQDPIMNSRSMNKKFNLFAANENKDAGAEVAAMGELLGILDELERQGISMMSVDSRNSVYEEVRAVSKALNNRKGAVRTFIAPVRKLA